MASEKVITLHRELLETIAEQNDFKNYHIHITSGSAKGDNYLGEITLLTIREAERKLELILKSAQVGEFRDHFSIHKAYQREIFIYENVFVEFKLFQQYYGLSEPFQAHARFYGSCDTENNECLVMENLRDSGYSMWNRKIPMNPEHLTAVIKEYAKLHAVSLAMSVKKPKEFNELTKNTKRHVFEEYFTDKKKSTMFIETVMGSIWRIFEDDTATTDILKEFEKNLPEIFEKMTQESSVVVIDHGDCWCNNFMFSYKDQEKKSIPAAVRIIDWQISKANSPAVDLVYFLLVNSSKEMLYEYEHFLRIYYDTLSKNLREFSCDPEEIFSYSTLMKHWNERVKYGIFMAFHVIKLMLCDPENAPDFSKMNESYTLVDLFSFESGGNDLFNEKIKNLVEFCIQKSFL